MSAVASSTHPAGFHRSLSGLLTFPLLLAIKGDAYGVGQYFGPLVLTLSPLLLFAFRKTGEVRAAAIVWGVVFLSIDLTSQMARFLLPVFPLAVALIFVGMAEAFRRRWWVIQLACAGTLLLTLAFGFGSEALYARDFLPVAVGLEKRDAFLGRMASDYLVTSFVNRSLEGRDGKAMVFFQHVYYLRVPFLIGDPQISWLMNPVRLKDPQALMDLFQQQNVRWVIKAPDYPDPFTSSFKVLEDEGKLRPLSAADVSTYSSFRIYGEKVPVHVVVMEVVPAP